MRLFLDARICSRTSAEIVPPLFGFAALTCLCLATFISPAAILVRVPSQADVLKPELFAGIQLARLVLLAVAILAVLNGWYLLKVRKAGDTNRKYALSGWDRRDWAVAAGIVLFAAAMRLPGLNRSLYGDELYTVVRVVRRGLPEIFGFSADANNHILNSLMIYVLTRIIGERDWIIKLPSFILGSLTPGLIYLVGMRFLPRVAVIISVCLIAVHLQYIDLSDEARGYAGAILFGALSCCLFWFLSQKRTRTVVILYVAATSLAAGFLVTALWLPVGQFLMAVAWAAREKRRTLILDSVPVLFSCAWGFLVGLLINIITIPQLIDYSKNRADTDHLKMGPNLAIGVMQFISGTHHLMVATTLLLAAVAGWVTFRNHSRAIAAIVFPPVFYLAGFTVLGLRGSPRVFVLLAFPLLVGIGLFIHSGWVSHSVVRRTCVLALITVLILECIPEIAGYYRIGYPPVRQVAMRLRTKEVFVAGEFAAVSAAYYFPKAKSASKLNQQATLLAIKRASPRPQYIVFATIKCPAGALGGIQGLGYHPIERFANWRNIYPIIKQPGPCYVIYAQ